MTTKYTVKRCKTFGFAQTLRNGITLFQPEDYTNSNIFYIHSSKTEPSQSLTKLNSSTKNILSINNIEPNNSQRNLIFVELGFGAQR